MNKQKEFDWVKDIPIKKVPNMGKVVIHLEYPVDLNEPEMVDYAKESLYEDIASMIKYDEVSNVIAVQEDSNLSYDDIPEFLVEYVKDLNSWEE